MIGRAPCGGRRTQCSQVQLANEGINHTNRIVLGDEVIQALGQKRDLPPILTFDVSRHVDLGAQYAWEDYQLRCNAVRGFSHSLGRQWLRWMLVPRLQALPDANAPLLGNCSVYPLTEHEWSLCFPGGRAHCCAACAGAD